MRRTTALAALVAVLLVGGLLWSAVARVPADGEIFAWNADDGTLEVRPSGLHLLPRWRWERTAASTLETAFEATSREGVATKARVRWSPLPGTYRLPRDVSLQAGFDKQAGDAIRRAVAALSIDCLTTERASGEGSIDCPENPRAFVSAAVAEAIESSRSRVKTVLEVSPAAQRELLVRHIADALPRSNSRVLLLGLDGLDWDLVLPWVRTGRMPNLARLMDAGTWGVMETIVPTLSPLIWTSVATGVPPDRHGILDFVEKDPARGLMVPVTGRSRKVPALWNLVSALGRSVAIVGWWGSWPAERVNGVMVSDRLYYTLTQGLTKEVVREDPPEMVFPAERRKEFVELRNRAVRETDWQALRYFMNVPERVFDAAVAADGGMEDPVDGFRRLLAATRTYLGAGLLAAKEKPDLVMVYLEGTDTIGHLLAPYMPPPTLEVDPALAELYVAAVPRYFEIVDRWIGRYLEKYPLDEHNVVVVSDHGFKWSEKRPGGLSGTEGPTAALWHEPDAVFVVAGPGVKPLGRSREEASIYDVAPTVMSLLDLPLDPSWMGQVLPGCPQTELEPIEYAPLVPPASYRQETGDAAPVDPEFISKLRALGYLGGSEAEAPSVPAPARAEAGERQPEEASQVEAAKPLTGATRGELNNLAIIKIGEKKYDEAESLLRLAIEQSPTYASPHFNLRRIFMETERWVDADRELWIAVDKGLRDPERTLDRAAADYETLGLPERAVVLLDEALARFPGHEPFWVHSMVAKVRVGDCRGGFELGPEAARRFPDSAPVHAFYGLAAACVGDIATARREMELSLALNPDQATLRRTMSELPSQS